MSSGGPVNSDAHGLHGAELWEQVVLEDVKNLYHIHGVYF